MQINLIKIKEWLFANWTMIALLIVLFFYFKSCEGSKELELTSKLLKEEVELSENKVSSLLSKNELLLSNIDSLQKLKQKVKIEIVEVQIKTDTEVKKVSTLTTKGIASFYQNRYQEPVTITQYGVALSDTLAKKNIVDIVKFDGCIVENSLLKKELQLEEQKGVIKDTVIINLNKAVDEYSLISDKQNQIIKNAENSVKKEKSKKTFWQVATGAAILGASYLLISK